MLLVKISSMIVGAGRTSSSCPYKGAVPDFLQKIRTDYTFAMIVMAIFAKLTRIDSEINPQELKFFKYMFVEENPVGLELYDMFVMAFNDTCGASIYARRLSVLYGDLYNLKQEVMLALFHHAAIDGPINNFEMSFLKKISSLLGLGELFIKRAVEISMKPVFVDYYSFLDIDRNDITKEKVQKAYYEKIRLYHPDSNRNIAKEAAEFTGNHIQILNDAYKNLKENFV